MTGRRALLAAAAAGIAAGARAQGAARDLMPAFWRAYDAAGAGSFEERGRALIGSYLIPQADAYRAAGVGRVDLARWLAVFDPMAARVRAVSDGFAATWATHAARFARLLPDFDQAAPVTVFVSFLQFDARVRADGGAAALFVGLDGLVHYGATLPVLLAHECFHLYHHQVNPTLVLPGGDPLWLGVWKEGLAVHASGMLNPEADARAILLGEAALAAADAAMLRGLAGAMLPVLDEVAGLPRQRFLNVGGGDPSRGGYLAGLAIVRRAAAGRDLAALARIPAAEIRAIVQRETAALARG